ncbi:MAG: hypothetical protein ABIK89_17985 [Planctomycetota bacterium]
MGPSRFVGCVLLAVLVTFAGAPPARSACGAPYRISTTDAAGDRSFVWTENVFTPNYYYPGHGPIMFPGNPPVTAEFEGLFWAYGVGEANNNGTFGVENWFSAYALPSYLFYEAGRIDTS